MDSDIYAVLSQESMNRILNSNNVLLSFEKEGIKAEGLKQIKSEIHTLKGDTRMLGFKALSDAAHRVEDFLQVLEKADVQKQKALIGILYKLLDAIENAVKQLPSKVDIDLTAFPTDDAKEKPNAPVELPPSEPKAPAPKSQEETGETIRKSEYLNIKMARVEELITMSSSFPRYSSKFTFLLNHLREIEMQLSDLIGDEKLLKSLGGLIQDFSHQLTFFDLTARRFQDSITRMKLVALATVFEYFPRLVRDVATHTGKEVNFTIAGKEVELDKFIVDNIKDALIHLLRNAVDHGIEMPEERTANGKQRAGRINLKAVNKGDTVNIEVSDDGQGLDIEKIRTSAVRKGLISEEVARALSVAEVTALIFQSGFSTKEIGTFSGRGIGMDVVARTLQETNGEIKVRSTQGKGTTFVMSLPLISSYISITIFALNDRLYGLPSSYIESILVGRKQQLKIDARDASRLSINFKEMDISLLDLQAVFKLGRNTETDNFKLIICRCQDEVTGFIVSDVVMEKKLIISRISCLGAKLPIILGGALLGMERVIPVLNVPELFKALKSDASLFTRVLEPEQSGHEIGFKNILVVEDSLVTRATEKRLLLEQNFNIHEASNGKEALTLLEKEKIDGIFTDIEMPVMNGIEFITCLKADARYRQIPVSVVSSYKNYAEKLATLKVDQFIDKGDFNKETLVQALRHMQLL